MASSAASQDALEVQEPGQPGRRLQLKPPRALIGRDSGCDIWLADAAVSRRHAQLQTGELGAWVLTDLGSRNGTFVNGQQVHSTILNSGDRVRIGDCELILRLSERRPSEQEQPFVEFVELGTLPPKERRPWAVVGQYAELARRLNQSQNLEELVDCLAAGCVEMCKAQRAAVGLFEEGQLSWAAWAPPEGAGAALPSFSDAVRKRLLLESLTFRRAPDSGEVQECDAEHASGELLFPIRSGGRTFGLFLLWTDPAKGPLRKQEVWLV
ncbi:MAG: FHA domain-containing protein, partial [Planctomycetota bacterium]